MQWSGRGPTAADALRLVAHDLETADLAPPQHVPQIIDFALDNRGPVTGAWWKRVVIGT